MGDEAPGNGPPACTHFEDERIDTELSCVESWPLLGWEKEVINYVSSRFVHAFSDISWNEFYIQLNLP